MTDWIDKLGREKKDSRRLVLGLSIRSNGYYNDMEMTRLQRFRVFFMRRKRVFPQAKS